MCNHELYMFKLTGNKYNTSLSKHGGHLILWFKGYSCYCKVTLLALHSYCCKCLLGSLVAMVDFVLLRWRTYYWRKMVTMCYVIMAVAAWRHSSLRLVCILLLMGVATIPAAENGRGSLWRADQEIYNISIQSTWNGRSLLRQAHHCKQWHMGELYISLVWCTRLVFCHRPSVACSTSYVSSLRHLESRHWPF